MVLEMLQGSACGSLDTLHGARAGQLMGYLAQEPARPNARRVA